MPSASVVLLTVTVFAVTTSFVLNMPVPVAVTVSLPTKPAALIASVGAGVAILLPS